MLQAHLSPERRRENSIRKQRKDTEEDSVFGLSSEEDITSEL